MPARADSRPLRHRHHPSPTPNCLKFPAGSFRARPLVSGPARSNKAARVPIPRPRRSARFFGGARFRDKFLGRASAPCFAHTRCFSVIDFVQNYYPERLVSIPLRPPLSLPISLIHIHAHEHMYRDADTFASRCTRTRALSRSRARAGAFKHTHAGTHARMNASVSLLHTDTRATTQTHGHMRMHRDRIWRHRAGNDAHYQRPYRLLGPMEGAFPSMRVLVAYEVMQQRCSCMHTCVRPHAWGR